MQHDVDAIWKELCTSASTIKYFNLRVTSELLTKGRHDSQTVTDELAAICIELQNTAVLLISLFRIIEEVFSNINEKHL